MKKKIALCTGLLVCGLSLCGCNAQNKTLQMNVPTAQTIELNGEVRFAPQSTKPTNVSGYEITVIGPDGKEITHDGFGFKPSRAGDYIITYDALDKQGEVFLSKNTLLTVVPAQAPDITIKQFTDTLVWNYGVEYILPSAQVRDNFDTDLDYELTVTDEDGQTVRTLDGKIVPQKGGFYTLTYTATDSVGNIGEEKLRIFATDKGEISSFEVENLMNMFEASDDNSKQEDNGVYSMSYNTDKAYTYGGSEGSLKFHCEQISGAQYPAIVINGSNLAHKNLSETDYDGISFKLYFEGNANLTFGGESVFMLYVRTSDGKQVAMNLKNTVVGFGTDKWIECKLTKTWLENAILSGTQEKFGSREIAQIRIMTMITGDGEYLDTYLDDMFYFKY